MKVMLFSTLGGAAVLIWRGGRDQGPALAILLAGLLALSGRAWADHLDNRSGFTMTLGFVRPIPTGVLVSVPMAYVALSTAIAYLFPMIVLRGAFGVAFPLLPVAALVATVSLAILASQW